MPRDTSSRRSPLPPPATAAAAPAGLFALPHPVRTDAVLGADWEGAVLDELGVGGLPPGSLRDTTLTSEALLNQSPAMAQAAQALLGARGSYNLGAFLLLLARARLRAHGDPILEVSPALQELLGATDLAERIPAAFFRCPYAMVYVAFARPCPLQITNRASGAHEVEGAYVASYEVPAWSAVHENRERSRALGLEPGRPTRVLEIVITGSPVGKRNPLDDATSDLAIFIQDEDACLTTLLERHYLYYASAGGRGRSGFEPPQAEEWSQACESVGLLARVLLYLNLHEAERVPFAPRRELERRLQQVGPKKAARLRARLGVAYDRIVIGPRVTASEAAAPPATAGGAVRSHWRRGHFRRIRYGEGRSEARLGWIRPVLVNASAAFAEDVKKKTYTLR